MRPIGSYVYINSERDDLVNNTSIGLSTTDPQGRYHFHPQDKNYSLLVTADQGFARIKSDEMKKDGTINLQNWARIEGDYRLNAGPAASVKLQVTTQIDRSTGSGDISFSRITTTDENGHFVFDQIPPGIDARLEELVSINSNETRYRKLGTYAVASTQPLVVKLGGNGRPIIGKILPPAAAAPMTDFSGLRVNCGQNADLLKILFKLVSMPDDLPDQTPEQQRQWFQQAMKNPEVIAAIKKKTADDNLSFNPEFILMPNGTFRADNVFPGTYVLDLILREPPGPGNNHQTLIGLGSATVTVPASPCPSDTPIDLGVIQLSAPAELKIGSPLPDGLDLLTLDGKPVDRTAWAGKVTILHIWNTQHRALFPAIHTISNQYKDNPNVQIVNVGSMIFPAWARHVDSKEHLPGLTVMEKASYNLQNTSEQLSWLVQRFEHALILDASGRVTADISNANELPAAIETALKH